MSAPRPAIRDAATVILVRRAEAGPQVLMGQRGAGAAFMPSKFVFPGGALDAEDVDFAAELAIDGETERLLSLQAAPQIGRGLALCAIRELWEETGLALGRRDAEAVRLADAAPEGLRSMFASGIRPDAHGLRFVFRAITPPGRPRRFDARFFMAEAAFVCGDPDDFSGACGELAHLRWLSLAEARALELPFITEVVLGEVGAALAEPGAARPVPFFHHDGAGSYVSLI